MTIEEFILIDKTKVRRDSNLMSLYLDFFKQAFNKLPNCAGCSFGTDWQKLVSLYSKKAEKKVTLQKGKIMNTITIKKIQGKILTYKKGGKTYRQYDNILTDSFIKEYISNGTDEEIKERSKMFNFPSDYFVTKVQEMEIIKLSIPLTEEKIEHRIPESFKQKRGRKAKK